MPTRPPSPHENFANFVVSADIKNDAQFTPELSRDAHSLLLLHAYVPQTATAMAENPEAARPKVPTILAPETKEALRDSAGALTQNFPLVQRFLTSAVDRRDGAPVITSRQAGDLVKIAQAIAHAGPMSADFEVGADRLFGNKQDPATWDTGDAASMRALEQGRRAFERSYLAPALDEISPSITTGL